MRAVIFLLLVILTVTGCAPSESNKVVDVYTPQAAPALETVPSRETSKDIGSDGGEVILSNADIGLVDLKITIPEGALSVTEKITVRRLDENQLMSYKMNSLYTKIHFSPVFELSSDSNFFSKNITIQFPFIKEGLPENFSASDVSLVYYADDKWNEVGGYTVNTDYSYITANLDHFTPFVIVYTGWPNYERQQFRYSSIELSKYEGYLNLELKPSDAGIYGWDERTELFDSPYSNFETVTIVRLRRKIHDDTDSIVIERQYHNAVLLNKTRKMAFLPDEAAIFSPWNVGENMFSAWQGYTGFAGPYEMSNGSLGIKRYLITVNFDSNEVQTSKPKFEEISVPETVSYDGKKVIGDFMSLFTIKDNLVLLDEIRNSNDEYYVEIKSMWTDAGNDKFYSQTAPNSIFIPNDLPPEQPKNPEVNGIGENYFTVSWSKNPYPVSYNIYVDGVIAAVTTDGTYLLSGLNANTVYNVEVSSESRGGESPKSLKIQALTLPSVPVNLVSSDKTTEGIQLKWDETAGISRYNVYKNGSLYKTVNTNKTTVTVSSDSVYNLEVSCINASGEGAKSEKFEGIFASDRRWVNIDRASDFSARESFSALDFSGKLWIMAGMNDNTLYNDIWYTFDGITWTEATDSPVWGARSGQAAAVFSDKLWIAAGKTSAGIKNDVAYSADGVNWSYATTNASFAARQGHALVVMDEKMYIIAGTGSAGYLEDVWSSTDGVNWTQLTASGGFTARTEFSAFAFDEKLWIAGGMTSSGVMNDIWSSSDGITWTQVAVNAEFAPRCRQSSAVYDGKLWIAGGYTAGGLISDVWYSADGINWKEETGYASFAKRQSAAMASYGGNLYLFGGITDTEVKHDAWRLITDSPQNPAAASITETSYSFSWAGISDAVRYHVLLDNTEYITTNQTSVIISGLNSNTEYKTTVYAECSDYNTIESAPVDVFTLPSAPAGILSSSHTVVSFILSWDALPHDITYHVYKDNLEYAVLKTNSSTVSGLSANTSYKMEVSAENITGEGNKSAALNVLTLPSSPTGLAYSNLAYSSFTLNWTMVPGLTYHVYRNSVKIATVTTNTYNVTGLSDNTAYTMQVEAQNTTGLSAKSATLNVLTPLSPTNYTAAIGSTGLSFTTGGNANWETTNIYSKDGFYSVVNGNISDNQISWFQTTVNTGGVLTFWWKTRSESGWDYLIFTSDSVEQDRISGDIPNFAQKQYTLGAGTHTFRWTYEKNGTISQYYDSGYLDMLTYDFSPSISAVVIGGSSGDIPITYTLTDGNSDACSIAVYYSLDSGVSWTQTINLTGSVSGITPGTGKTITWNSGSNFSTNETGVKIKIAASDSSTTGPETESGVFTVSNNSLPVISNVTASGNRGDISVQYSISDGNGDACSITVYYSLNGGTSWTATGNITGTVAGITPGVSKSFIWNSLLDFTSNKTDVKVKIVPNDGKDTGQSGETASFAVDNS